MRPLLAVLLMLGLALAGCSGDDEPDDGGADDGGTDPDPGTGIEAPILVEMTMSAVGAYPINPALSPASFQVIQGSEVTITYSNEDANVLVDHDLFISGVDVQSESISPGESTMVTFIVDLEPGEYPYWCAIGNHREAGMEGIMTVIAP